jgi:endonuclease YncB( thermonuclease family)
MTKTLGPPAWRQIRAPLVLLLFGALCAAAPFAAADTLQGVVVAIQDGDTLTLLDEGNTQHRVRLAGIDAPEKGQPFGQRSKEELSSLVYRREVTVEWHKRDRYGRVVGKVLLTSRDINLAQVQAGLAWHYVDYAQEQPPADRVRYSEAEASARAARLGLWSESVPVAPWAFRKARRE